MKRLLTLLVAGCLIVGACSSDNGTGLFNGKTLTGGKGNGATGTGANAPASGTGYRRGHRPGG